MNLKKAECALPTFFVFLLAGSGGTEWWQVGRHIDFSLPVWDIALLAIERTLDLEPEAEAPGEERPSRGLELPSDLITVHIRRGDFATWCASGSGCVAPIETYVRAVAELKQQLANDAATG